VEFSVSSVAWWAILAIVIIVAVAVLVLLGMSARQLLRIQRRLNAYATLPIVAAVERAQVNAVRIDTAVAQVAPLIARAETAMTQIGRGPVPPDVAAGLGAVTSELHELREL
jgi:hypothetical protein